MATDTQLSSSSLAKSAAVERPGLQNTQSEEEILLSRVAIRDIGAFSSLYDRFSQQMFSLAFRIVLSRPDAEDILQDGFLIVWHQASDYRSHLGSPFTWIATIIRRKAIDRLRAHCRRAKLHFRMVELCPDAVLNGTESGRLITQERSHEVRSALAELRGDEQRAIKLAYFEGLTQMEIATLLQIPSGTVKARIRRALLKLRKKLRIN